MNERINNTKLNAYGDKAIMSSSIVYDNQHEIKKFDKSIFFTFLKISLAVSAFMSFFFILLGDLNNVLIFSIVGFFGTFVILTVIFYIERLYEVILNKIKGKKTET
jgi:hypothetical protein